MSAREMPLREYLARREGDADEWQEDHENRDSHGSEFWRGYSAAIWRILIELPNEMLDLARVPDGDSLSIRPTEDAEPPPPVRPHDVPGRR